MIYTSVSPTHFCTSIYLLFALLCYLHECDSKIIMFIYFSITIAVVLCYLDIS